MNLEQCFICEETLSRGETVDVKERGIKTLIESSIERKDNKQLFLRGLNCVTVHVKCRISYINKKLIIASLRAKEKAVPSVIGSRRSNIPSFDFKTTCLFCAEDASEEFVKNQTKKNVARRDTVHVINTMQVKENILETAKKRGDTWGETVSMRILNVMDLVAAQGRYHGSCMRKFFHSLKTYEVPGRPETEYTKTAIDFICSFLEEHRDECQFSLTEILKEYKGTIPTNDTLKKKLQEKYGDDIIFTTKQKKKLILCFRDTGHKILTSNWYEKRNLDIKEERLRIVKAAAEIITEDIRSEVYETNNYPPTDIFLKNVENDIPNTLQLLLNLIITKNKRGSLKKWNAKAISIAHAIIVACRPKSFLSSLQVGLGAFVFQKYGSKDLLNILSALGFCATYDEIKLFEASSLIQPQPSVMEHSFSQFVFDNADHNVNTIDGFQTFHAMGGIQCITPATSVSSNEIIPRLKNIPSACTVGTLPQGGEETSSKVYYSL